MAETGIDHLGLRVADYAKARRFDTAAPAALGLRLGREYPKSVTGDFDVGMFGPGGQTLFVVAGGGKAMPPVHLAFRTENRAAIDAFYAASLTAGGKDNGPPGIREHHHANYYAAFVHDPDGNNIEAVTHKPA